MFKRAKVVMLPTNKSKIYIGYGQLKSTDDNHLITNSRDFLPQHFYIISDDEIKEGDWCIGNNKIHSKSPDNFFIAQCTSVVNGWIYLKGHEGEGNNPDYTEKIIATTDNNLSLRCTCGADKIVPTGLCSNCGKFINTIIPQPSQSFIEKYITEYNKGNIISNVMVDYEEHFEEDTTKSYVRGLGQPAIKIEQLRVDKNNCVTITKVKDSWSKEEIKEFLPKAMKYACDQRSHLDHMFDLYAEDWIEENL